MIAENIKLLLMRGPCFGFNWFWS